VQGSHLLAAPVKKRLGADWYKDRDFWRLYAPYIFGADRWIHSADEARAAVSLTNTQEGAKVLDACCGVGRHSIELARMGFAVTGIDLNPDYLEAAEASARAEGFSVNFVCQDVLRLDLGERFDLAVNMYISFGYFDTEEENLLFLKNLHACLAPGGRLLVETLGKEHKARCFTENEWYEDEGVFVLARYAVTDDWSRLQNRWIVIDGETRHDYTFAQRLYCASEIKALFREAGFSGAKVYGSLRGDPYDHRAESLVVVGTK
jgi:SAM-dependent methyltransferase